MSADAHHGNDPVADTLSSWGVSDLVVHAERHAFQTWRGHGSTWGGRLADGRSVVIAVQDTLAEPRFGHGSSEILDPRDEARKIAEEARSLGGNTPCALIPCARVEHNHAQALLLWMRESTEGEDVGIPWADASPSAPLRWLTPVAETVDWARRHLSFGLCVGPEELVWHGDAARVAGWGREAFDRLVTCRNREARVGVMEPDIRAGLTERHVPLRRPVDLSRRADDSVPALIATWLKLRLGKKQVWFEYQLDPLPELERAVLLRWLEAEPLRGGAAEFLRDLGGALR